MAEKNECAKADTKPYEDILSKEALASIKQACASANLQSELQVAELRNRIVRIISNDLDASDGKTDGMLQKENLMRRAAKAVIKLGLDEEYNQLLSLFNGRKVQSLSRREFEEFMHQQISKRIEEDKKNNDIKAPEVPMDRPKGSIEVV